MTTQTIDLDAKNKRLGFVLGGVALFMLPMSVFFYYTGNMICDYLGLGTNPDNPEVVAEGVSAGRSVKCVFGATIAEEFGDKLTFVVDEKTQRVEVGDGRSGRNTYQIKNTSNQTLHIRPIHFVSPAMASTAFQMTECFCYNDMELAPGEERELVVAYGFQADMDQRVYEAMINYNLEPIDAGLMRPTIEMPDTGSFVPQSTATRDLIQTIDTGAEAP